MNDVTFDHNTALGDVGSAGAMDIIDDSSAALTHVRFVGNSAGLRGGALVVDVGSGAQLINTLFSGNSALAEDGGGIYNLGILKIYNSTFWHNTAQKNGGALSNNTASVPVRNSIFWDNTAGGEGPQIFSGIWPYIDVQYNLIQGGYTGTGNTSGAPLFVNPNGVDGIPGTRDDDLHLESGSSAVDAGSNADVPAGTLADFDQNSRFADDPGMADTGSGAPPIVDMGAYERLAGTAPTPTSTPIPTSTPTPSATPSAPLPAVVKISTSPDTGDGQLSEGEIVRGAINYLSVTFNTDITNFKRQAWLLLAEGDQPGFQTTSCARPHSGDQFFLSNFQSLQFPSRTIVLGFYTQKVSTLPNGHYRFIVCDTITGSYPLLDGDSDGTPGGDFVRNFSIAGTPLTPTPTATATATATSVTATATATATATSTAIATTPTATPTSVPTSTPTSTLGLSPQLSIDYAVGRPGSSFTVTGSAFPPNARALVVVSGIQIGSITTDAVGVFRLFLDTSMNAAPGFYDVAVTVESGLRGIRPSSQSAKVGYSLRMSSVLRTHEPDSTASTLAVPAGIQPQNGFRIYIPLVEAS